MSIATVSQRVSTALRGRVFIALGGGVLSAVFLAVLVSKSSGSVLRVAAPGLLIAVAVWMFLSEHYERTLAVFALYLGLLDGFVKLKTGSSLATLGRDVLLYAITIGAVVRLVMQRSAPRLPTLSAGVICWVAICLAEVLNPVAGSTLHALAGTRQHLEFVPLFFFGYAVMRSNRRLTALLVLLIVAASANAVVAVIQEHLSLAELASWGPGYAAQVYGTVIGTARTFYSSTGEHIRPSALGSDEGFGGLLGILAVPAVLALASSWNRAPWRLVVAILGTPLVIVAVVTSQSRTAVVGAAVAGLAYLILTATTRKGAQTLATAGVLALVAYFALPAVFPSAVDQANRYSSIAPTRVISTAFSYRSGTLALVPQYMYDYPLGTGIGRNGPAAGSSVGGLQSVGGNAESEFNFLVLELGIPGLLILTGLTGTAICIGVRLRRIEDLNLQRSAMALVAANIGIGAVWFAGIMTANSPTSPFFWFTAGVIVYWWERARYERKDLRYGRRYATT
jgi:hypothetical protein